MYFQEKLDLYAKLIVHHGVNVQEGQDLYIASEIVHKDFVNLIVKHAYQRGARLAYVHYMDPRNTRIRILESKSEEYLSFVAPFVPYHYESLLNEHAASLRLIGSEFPDLLADLDPKKVHQVELAHRKSLKKFYEEGIGHSKVQWSVAGAATKGWAKRVFPELNEEKAYEALWEVIFHICRADKRDCLEQWIEHDRILTERATKLTDLKIETLHFTGPGTDLKVGLSKHAVFRGGGDSKSPRKARFEPNLPTEECFTTPDYRKTEGHVRMTRPFLINGKLIKGLELVFKGGEIVSFKAQEGEKTFAAYIESDPGAKRVGEVALVGVDSPVFQSGRIFEEILYDENAACHIAIGFAYKFCIEGSADWEGVGCNTSSVHTDMMISSEEVDVRAKTYEGRDVSLIRKGVWEKFTR